MHFPHNTLVCNNTCSHLENNKYLLQLHNKLNRLCVAGVVQRDSRFFFITFSLINKKKVYRD